MCLFQKSVARHAWRKRQWTLACSDQSTQGTVGHATHPRTPEAGRGGRMLHKFTASMVYRGSAKPVRTTQWDSHKHTKNGLPTYSKVFFTKKNVYWDTNFLVRRNQWLLCKKPSYHLLLFCFYLKQKKIIWSVISSWKNTQREDHFTCYVVFVPIPGVT